MTSVSNEAHPATPEPPPARSSPAGDLMRHVSGVVTRLQAGYVRIGEARPTSHSVGALATLRRGLGSAAGADTAAWAIVLDGFPETLMGPSRGLISAATNAERAAFAAITTWAVHQQGVQSQPMHVPGVGLGEATRRIARARARQDSAGGLDEQTIERMHRLALAHNEILRAQSLRALVTLMRGGRPPVGLDYGQLAADLFLLRTRHADGVRLRWGRGLHIRDENNQKQTTTDHTVGDAS